MDNSWRLGLAMGLSAGQSQLLMSLLLLLTHVQPGTGIAAPEHINYVPQLSNDTLAGRLTQSTFTLEQPLGQFHSHNISDSDTIWLVVALSNATQSFTAPRSNQDVPAPANFSQRGYYLTLRANRGLYLGGQARGQLRVLRVGNDTHCQPTKIGCNHPLPGPGPYRVKFLVMNDEGPVAETKWSSDTRLQQARIPLKLEIHGGGSSLEPPSRCWLAAANTVSIHTSPFLQTPTPRPTARRQPGSSQGGGDDR
nr:uroplakin-3b-like protein 2 [Macaca nemestrina]